MDTFEAIDFTVMDESSDWSMAFQRYLVMGAAWESPSIMTQYAAVIAGHSIALSLDISRPWFPLLLSLYLRKQSLYCRSSPISQ